jgi:hypothetical protein
MTVKTDWNEAHGMRGRSDLPDQQGRPRDGAMVRTALFEAANVTLTRAVSLSQGVNAAVAGGQGMKKAKVAWHVQARHGDAPH